MVGTCINSTGEIIAVYGPNSPQTPQDKDNALYRLPPGRKTPDGWDCDGIYVPNDRIAGQLIGSNIQGPVAIKYVDVLTFEIKKEGNKYKLPANQGAFKPNEVCCPSNYPSCVCWNIPNLAHNQLGSFPEVPGHVPT
jgi:hypothetical protein